MHGIGLGRTGREEREAPFSLLRDHGRGVGGGEGEGEDGAEAGQGGEHHGGRVIGEEAGGVEVGILALRIEEEAGNGHDGAEEEGRGAEEDHQAGGAPVEPGGAEDPRAGEEDVAGEGGNLPDGSGAGIERGIETTGGGWYQMLLGHFSGVVGTAGEYP